jgi:ribosome modulation factor
LPRAAKKIEPQDETEQQQPPPVDHNGETELTEGERIGILVRTLADIEQLTIQKDHYIGLIRTQRKRLIGCGFKSSLITYALRLRKSPVAEEIEQRRAEAEIARFLNHPIGTQPELPLVALVDRTPGIDRAFLDGEQAGQEGKTCECTLLDGPMQQSWIKGWHKGQDTILSAFGKLEAKEAAEAADEEEGED